MAVRFTAEEVNSLLERWDQTEVWLQRHIVVAMIAKINMIDGALQARDKSFFLGMRDEAFIEVVREILQETFECERSSQGSQDIWDRN